MQESMMFKKSNSIAPDPYAASVVLDISAYSGAIVDAKGHAITNTAVSVSTAQLKWGPYAMAFNGSAYMTLANTASDFWLAGDFTIECWMYLISRTATYPSIFGNYSSWPNANGLQLFAGHSNNPTKYQVAAVSTFPAITSTASVIYGAWFHYAFTRASGVTTLWIGGSANGTFSTSASLYGTKNVVSIGQPSDSLGGGGLNGYIERYRITNVARYTNSFTPQRF